MVTPSHDDAPSSDNRPVVIAYDGSVESRAAVTAAVRFFAGYRLLVVTVWEPGLATLMASAAGTAVRSPSGALTAGAAREERAEVSEIVSFGTELAKKLGAAAEPMPVFEAGDVADAIATEAERHEACALVTGSRGLGRVKAPLMGSTSQALLRRTTRPVLVVQAPRHQ